MSLESALRLAEYGFYVFPCVPGGKVPVDKGWQALATRDPKKIRLWWWDSILEIEQPYNIGISPTKFKDGRPLLVVDIDNKEGNDGDGEVLRLELQDQGLPDTFMQITPTGGRHLIYYAPFSVGNSSHRIAPGIDTRGRGGILIGAGSKVASGVYSANYAPLAEAPTWLVESVVQLKSIEKGDIQLEKVVVSEKYAEHRALQYLQERAPLAISGQGGNSTTYCVAAFLKDLGVSSFLAYELMSEHWNDRCEPSWADGELIKIIENAFAYGQEVGGVAAPEADFQPIIEAASEAESPPTNPIKDINREYAFVIAGRSHGVLWETSDEDGNFELKLLSEETFHRKFAGKFFFTGDGKGKPLTKAWIESGDRRSYDKIVFKPGKVTAARFYNLWRGFAVKPLRESTPKCKAALDAFLSHTRENVCQEDEELFKWLISYFAHLVQRPWERPDVALVFRGKKGVGKNALVERIGHLLGQHFGVAADQRYLAGNFNAHLENKLLFVLDEAFWSGDKKIEGILKHLVTGRKHNIERKGQEAYTVDNCLRVVVLGNEDWLVPASDDERRYAVFDVGNARKEDRKFFREMRLGMEAGGYGLLLQYLLDVDISDFECGYAPKTEALLDQKVNSLSHFHKWWLNCLVEGEISSGDFSSCEWPEQIAREIFRDSYRRYARNLGARWIADAVCIGKSLKEICPSINSAQITEENGRLRVYKIPQLAIARKEWEKFIGHTVRWEET